MDYFKIASWIDRRIEETRYIYIGNNYMYWLNHYNRCISTRLSDFELLNWHISFNDEIIEIGKSYKHKFRF